ncbi:hypothetical protein X777_13914, partial [Ooceraea biroi]
TSFARNILNESFPDRWTGRGGRISWPARSPDLTPLDFFLWRHLKHEVSFPKRDFCGSKSFEGQHILYG